MKDLEEYWLVLRCVIIFLSFMVKFEIILLVGNFWKLFLRVLEIFLSIEYKFNLEFSLAADLRNFGSNDSVTAGQ